MDGQISFFDMPVPEELFPQEDIDRALCRGGLFENGSVRIYKHFVTHADLLSRVEFLKEEYGVGGSFPAFVCEDHRRQFGIEYGPAGIRLSKNYPPFEKLEIPMSRVAKRIAYLIDKGIFVPKYDDDYLMDDEEEN